MDKQSVAFCHDKLEARASTSGNKLYFEYSNASDNLVRQGVAKFLKQYNKDPFETVLWQNNRCIFCGSFLETSRNNANYNEDGCEWTGDFECDEFVPTYSYRKATEYCRNCSYWRIHYLKSEFYGSRGLDFTLEYKSLASKVRDFGSKLPLGCSTELAAWMRRHPDQWNSMPPKHLEQLVAAVYKSNHKEAEVIHVGQPNDGGIDVLFADSGGIQWLIQVKRRENPSSSESVQTIRNLLGTMVIEGNTHGIVVSTADHFTYSAYQAVDRAKERGMILELIDRGKLNRMLQPMLKKKGFYNALQQMAEEDVDMVAGILSVLGDKADRNAIHQMAHRTMYLNDMQHKFQLSLFEEV